MDKPSHLTGVALNARSPEKLGRFYSRYLGMKLHHSDAGMSLVYSGQNTHVLFHPCSPSSPYQHHRNDLYWKIGITIPNVDMAYEQLRKENIEITEPAQFKDIGYLCHLTDPEGFQIELLQHTFEGEKRTSDGDPTLPLGGGALIGQITLRTNDIKAVLTQYQTQYGMKLLSKQPVPSHEFDLYFLAFTDENPPHSDLTSVENRPWLWQRPYTTLEIQHRYNQDAVIAYPNPNEAGFAGLLFST